MSNEPYLWEGMKILTPITIRSNQDVFTVEKLDKSLDRSVGAGQRWDLQFSVISTSNDIDIFSILTEGIGKKHTMVMPGLANVPEDTGTTTATASAGSDSVFFATEPTPGTFIQFSSHTKVYTYLGGAKIFPALRKDVSGLVVTGRNVNLHYYINDSAIQGINYRNGFIAGIQGLNVWEAV